MSGIWVDRLGTVAASACAVHCAVVAFAPALLSVVGLGVLHDERFEWGFVVCAVVFAGVAAVHGHRTHRGWGVTSGFAVGAMALLGARVLEVTGVEGGLWLALFGGGALVSAHVLNTLRCRACAAGTCE